MYNVIPESQEETNLEIHISNSVVDYQCPHCIAHYSLIIITDHCLYLYNVYACISYKTNLNKALHVFSQDSRVVGFDFKSVIIYLPVCAIK